MFNRKPKVGKITNITLMNITERDKTRGMLEAEVAKFRRDVVENDYLGDGSDDFITYFKTQVNLMFDIMDTYLEKELHMKRSSDRVSIVDEIAEDASHLQMANFVAFQFIEMFDEAVGSFEKDLLDQVSAYIEENELEVYVH